jgi:RHS repeat-associated protein
MMQDNNGTRYTYDAENRISSVSGFTYVYDADGNRVLKTNGGTTPATGTLYWHMSPEIVAESDLFGNLQSEYLFFAGERVARKDFPGNAVSYYFSDHLKTASVVSDATGSNIKSESDYYPWGGELPFANADSNHYKFGGHERDSETGLDYMLARYYSNPLGRFLTPDWAAKPVAVPYAVLGDPQTLNLYTYVRNIPTTRMDPDGHCVPACPAIPLAVGGGGAATTALELASGPVGWIILGTTVIVVGGYIGYKHYKSRHSGGGSQAAAKPAPQSTPAVPPPPPIPGQGQGKNNGQQKGKGSSGSSSSNSKTHQTYTKTNSQTGEVYSGRTSGSNAPEENVAARDASHHMNDKGFGPAELDKSSTNADAIRGREQQLIQQNGGAQSQGGTSGNAINGVSDSNPKADVYKNAAEKEFGKPKN